MKIAFVYDVIYPYVKGGVEKRVWELASRLSHRGHDVHLFGMNFWDDEEILLREGVFLHGVCPSQKLYSGGRRTIWQALFFSIHLFFPLRKERFDIIDCQQFPLFSCITSKAVSRINNIPLIITWYEVWGDYWFDYMGYTGILGKAIERYIASFHNPVITVSCMTAGRFLTYFFRPVTMLIPVGIDIPLIRSIYPSAEKSDIIFVGRLIKEKNVCPLVQAFHILTLKQPDLRLTIIGDGPERSAITLLIKGLSLESKVSVLGFMEDHNEVIARLKSSKVFVLPSTREGFGISALEALACGIPVVTVDHPANAIRDLITEDNGFLCSLSAEDLAETICLALRHHADMRESCMASAEQYDWDRIVSEIELYYRSLIVREK
jgi:L-malate glycosyltransferase